MYISTDMYSGSGCTAEHDQGTGRNPRLYRLQWDHGHAAAVDTVREKFKAKDPVDISTDPGEAFEIIVSVPNL